MHTFLSLGPSGNMQGSPTWFDVLANKVDTCRTFKLFPYPHRYIDAANRWGQDIMIKKVWKQTEVH